MTTLIVIFSVILLILGLIGSVLPIIPGPPVSFIGLLLLHYFTPFFLSEDLLIYFGLVAAIITFLDYWLQIYSVKIFGGGRASTIGVIIGILFGVWNKLLNARFLGSRLFAYV